MLGQKTSMQLCTHAQTVANIYASNPGAQVFGSVMRIFKVENSVFRSNAFERKQKMNASCKERKP